MSAHVEAQPSSAVGEEADPRRWLALAVVLLVVFMELLHITSVNVVIPPIQRSLGASYSAIQWIAAGYTLASALALITGGRLGDIVGRKRMLLVGIGGFAAASALCAVAQSPAMLIGSRVLQGAMTAIMLPQVLSVIQVTFPIRERPVAFGLYGAVAGLATLGGPLIGGLLVQANLFGLGWRAVFLLNALISLVALAVGTVVVAESKGAEALRLDLVGMVIVTLGLLLLIYPLVQGREIGSPAWILGSMAASLPVFALFALYERRKTRIDGSPLVPLGLFRQRAFVAGLLISLIFFAGFTSFFFVFVVYLQIGLGFPVLRAGLTALPWSAGITLAAAASVRFAPRVGRRLLSLGALLTAAGMLGMILTIDHYGTAVTSSQFLPALLLSGLGMGLVTPTLVDIVLTGIPDRDAGSASGVLNTVLQLGSAVGIAAIGAVFFGLLAVQAGASANAVAPQVRAGLQTAGVPEPVQEQIVDDFRTCFQDRATGDDPSAVPPSCEQAQRSPEADPRIQQVVSAAAIEAGKQNFSTAIQRVLWYEAGVFLVIFLLTLLLPKKRVGGSCVEDPRHMLRGSFTQAER